jgi:hypothetical protein
MPSSGGEGRDLAAWILADLGPFLLLLLLRWSEGRWKERAGASFNNQEAEHHPKKCGSGGRSPFLAGLGGEGESVRLLVSSVVDKLLAGRGGEEEPAQAGANSSASSRRSYLYWIRLVVAGHRLGFSLAYRGGEEGEAADSPSSAYRSQSLPKWCYRSAATTVLHKRRRLAPPLFVASHATCNFGAKLTMSSSSFTSPGQRCCMRARALAEALLRSQLGSHS